MSLSLVIDVMRVHRAFCGIVVGSVTVYTPAEGEVRPMPGLILKAKSPPASYTYASTSDAPAGPGSPLGRVAPAGPASPLRPGTPGWPCALKVNCTSRLVQCDWRFDAGNDGSISRIVPISFSRQAV